MPLLSTFGAASARSFGGIGAAAAGAGLDVDEIFSTFLYDGNSSSASSGATQTINNGIDLSGEGGLVWIKRRDGNLNHALFDTARGAGAYFASNLTAGHYAGGDDLTSFNSNGFTLGDGQFTSINYSSYEYVSWTWRKAPKFFDIINHTQTGSEPSTVTLNHNLGCDVGMIIAKVYSHTNAWIVWHKDLGSNYVMDFSTDAKGYFGGTGVSTSSTSITIPGSWVHAGYDSQNTVLYVFAHNNNDGEFGPDKDKDVIKCGSYTGNGSSTGPILNLGFEPQFLMVKRTDASGRNWNVYDSMRDFNTTASAEVSWNLPDAENYRDMSPTPTGFQPETTSFQINASGGNYIYMAIRRGPLAIPEDVTKLFSIDTQGSSAPYFDSNHIVDMAFVRPVGSGGSGGGGAFNYARLMGEKYLKVTSRNAEANASEAGFDFMDGHIDQNWGGTNTYSWMWKRAPGFFDVTTWKVDATGNQTINHNLGVVPEFIISKNRNQSGNGDGSWFIAHKDMTNWDSANENTRHTFQDWNVNASSQQGYHKNFTSTQINMLSNGAGGFNTGDDVIAYLFATLPGISKVGGYTGTGSAQNIDCGFSSGARFVLLKASDSSGPWILIDSLRGISTGGYDPQIEFNDTAAQSATANNFNAHSAGFGIATGNPDINASGTEYIFYAVA